MSAISMRDGVQLWLSGRSAKPGDSIQLGWLVFQVVMGDTGIEVESLDFENMASFTRDFTRAEAINAIQQQVLGAEGVDACDCTLIHAAVVSASYRPGHPNTFMQRLESLRDSDSGWYVGVEDDPLDIHDPSNLSFRSLYELSIGDNRLIPFWLLPAPYLVKFDGSDFDLVSRPDTNERVSDVDTE